MQTELVLAFLIVFTLDSVSPGPAVAAVMARAAARGVTRTLPFVTGLVVGDLVLLFLALAGLAALAQAMGPAFAVIKWAGVAYLLYMAWQLWRAAPGATDAGSGADAEGGFWIGALLPLGNPKAIGFYVAILPSVFDTGGLSWATIGALVAIVVLVWWAVLAAYALLAAQARRLATGPTGLRLLNRASALGLTGAAATIAVRQ
ncbi:MAG: LysE family translocator [Pseudomonadota bacterium]